MTRTVFTNAETAHAWGQNYLETGRSNNGQFYFHGPALFSYGTHFLAGFIMPDGVALLNGDSYSITTGRHMSHAWGAVSHRTRYTLPDLTEIGAALARVAFAQGESRPSGVRGYCPDLATARRDVRAWAVAVLERDGLEAIGAEALAYVLGAVGLGRSVSAVRREAAQAIARREARAEAERERQAESKAGLWASPERAAALPDGLARIVAGELPQGAPYGCAPLDYLRDLNREALAAQKWAKGRRGWIRAHRKIQAARAQVRQAIAKREAIESRRLAWAGFKRAAPIFRAALDSLETGQVIGATLQGAERAHAQRGGTLEGAELVRHLAACEAMTQLSHLERAPTATAATRAAWAALRERLAPLARDGAEALAADLRAAQERREAERLERERAEREAWESGENPRGRFAYYRTARGGAYLRAVGVERDESGTITGGTLETSQGATVPLAHALRVFRFLRHCRETGTPWQRNGRTIRVGLYQVDSVEADGTFRAGCHLIEWPQVERLAERLGVADLAPDSSVAQVRGAA